MTLICNKLSKCYNNLLRKLKLYLPKGCILVPSIDEFRIIGYGNNGCPISIYLAETEESYPKKLIIINLRKDYGIINNVDDNAIDWTRNLLKATINKNSSEGTILVNSLINRTTIYDLTLIGKDGVKKIDISGYLESYVVKFNINI